MNPVRIGKFIAECRKEKHLTQMQLAEKLNITDRAVSKWENGKAMPDTSIMLDVCRELGISVNELLSGERIEMNEYDKKSEELLLELAKQDEMKNKKLMTSMWCIGIISTLFYIGIVLLTCALVREGPMFAAIVVPATLIFFIAVSIAGKFEVDAGYYECKHCHHKFVPSYGAAMMTMHFGTTRHLKCPHCQKRSWAKKVMLK